MASKGVNEICGMAAAADHTSQHDDGVGLACHTENLGLGDINSQHDGGMAVDPD